jgi:hypothetical protein
MTWATVPAADPITTLRRRLTELTHDAARTARAMFRRPTPRPKPHRYRAHREAFIEDAAMAREMLRL